MKAAEKALLYTLLVGGMLLGGIALKTFSEDQATVFAGNPDHPRYPVVYTDAYMDACLSYYDSECWGKVIDAHNVSCSQWCGTQGDKDCAMECIHGYAHECAIQQCLGIPNEIYFD